MEKVVKNSRLRKEALIIVGSSLFLNLGVNFQVGSRNVVIC